MNNFDFGGCDCLWIILLLMCCGGLGNSCGNSGCGGGCNCNIIPVLVALSCGGGCNNSCN